MLSENSPFKIQFSKKHVISNRESEPYETVTPTRNFDNLEVSLEPLHTASSVLDSKGSKQSMKPALLL